MVYKTTFALGFWLFLTIQSLYAQQSLDGIVAVVDDDIITRSELNTALANTRKQIQQRGTAAPPPDVLQRQVLERLIIDQLQARAAERNGITIDDPTLNAAVESIAQRNKLSLNDLRREVEKDGIPYPQFREQIRRELVAARLRQRVIDTNLTVSEQEITNFLEQVTNSKSGNNNNAREYRIAQILISVPEGASPDQVETARAKAEQVLGQLRQGADFNELAVAVSDGRQALEGGDLGWRSQQQLPTLFANTVPGLQPGEVSDLIRSPSGFHIVKLLEVRGGSGNSTAGTESQRNAAREQLLQRKSEEEWELWLRRLRDEAYVEIRL
jgi:peptidyl-prolyl cis-trans isomerase SurA